MVQMKPRTTGEKLKDVASHPVFLILYWISAVTMLAVPPLTFIVLPTLLFMVPITLESLFTGYDRANRNYKREQEEYKHRFGHYPGQSDFDIYP